MKNICLSFGWPGWLTCNFGISLARDHLHWERNCTLQLWYLIVHDSDLFVLTRAGRLLQYDRKDGLPPRWHLGKAYLWGANGLDCLYLSWQPKREWPHKSLDTCEGAQTWPWSRPNIKASMFRVWRKCKRIFPAQKRRSLQRGLPASQTRMIQNSEVQMIVADTAA